MITLIIPVMTTLDVLIDLSAAGLTVEPEDLESYSLQLAEELRHGDGLVEDARLVRSPNIPEGGKAGEAGFDLGFLRAEVNLKNIKALLDWLGDRIYGRTLEIEYGDVKLKYRTDRQLTAQIQALEQISELKIRVVKSEEGKG